MRELPHGWIKCKLGEVTKINMGQSPPVIVAKINTLFSHLDKVEERLKEARDKLELYKQSLLKSAFEGKLTKQWRAENNPPPAEELLVQIKKEREKYFLNQLEEWKQEVKKWEVDGKKGRKPSKPKKPKDLPPLTEEELAELPELPEGWVWVTIEALCSHIVDCLHSTPKFTQNGKYCVDTTCIKNGKILFDKIRFVTEQSFAERIRRLKPQQEDVFFAREGTVGTALTLSEDIDICLGQRMMMFRTHKVIKSMYFMQSIWSPLIKMQYMPLIGGTTSPHLNIRDIKKIAIPVCSGEEQSVIIDNLSDKIQAINKKINDLDFINSSKGMLYQSILKRAFEVNLVPQDPNDEPASELLRKIRVQHS